MVDTHTAGASEPQLTLRAQGANGRLPERHVFLLRQFAA